MPVVLATEIKELFVNKDMRLRIFPHTVCLSFSSAIGTRFVFVYSLGIFILETRRSRDGIQEVK